MTLQFGASLTDDTRSVNYDRNTFIIQATAATATTIQIYFSVGLTTFYVQGYLIVSAGNTKRGSITVPLTSCLAGLD